MSNPASRAPLRRPAERRWRTYAAENHTESWELLCHAMHSTLINAGLMLKPTDLVLLLLLLWRSSAAYMHKSAQQLTYTGVAFRHDERLAIHIRDG